MFRVVLFSCCCLVMKSVVVAAPTNNHQDPTECKDSEIWSASGKYPCSVLTDENYPGQEWLGFYADNENQCKTKYNRSCCVTCREILGKISTPQTTTTTTTTTEAMPKNGGSEIEIKPQDTKFGGNKEYDVFVQQGQRSSDDVAMKITMEKENKQQQVLLRFHQKGRAVIDLY